MVREAWRFDRSMSMYRDLEEAYNPHADREDLLPVVQPDKTPEQMKMLMDRVKKSVLDRIDEKRLTAALRRLKPKEIKRGVTLFKQGDQANIFYVVEEGNFKVYKKKDDNNDADDKGEEVGVFNPEKPCIGGCALLGMGERRDTVVAESDSKLWEIDRLTYRKVLVKMAYEQRKRHMIFFGDVRLLDSVENYEKVRLCDGMRLKKFAKGEVIMKEGDKPDGIYFVEEGEAELKTKSGERKTLKRGDCFGELALLTTTVRDESCKAKTDCEITFLDVETFERLQGKLQALIKRRPGRFKKVCKEFLGTENPDDDILR